MLRQIILLSMLAFLRKPYRHLNKILVSAQALQHNYRQLQTAHPEAKICPVLKSNAYGHGFATVAPIFDSFGAPFLVVDSLYEAYELQKIKVKTPILILGYTHPDNFKVKRLPFHYAVFDLATAETLNTYQPDSSIHIFVDTGMSREGITLAELPSFLQALKKLTRLKVVGLASHLADADNPTSTHFTELQLANFRTALALILQAGFDPPWRHLANSPGSFKISDPICNMVRVGLSSYGLYPLKSADPGYKNLTLQPALKFISTLGQIKQLAKDVKVGYSGTFTSSKSMTVGIVPAGYYDGVDRRLSNKGVFRIRGIVCPIIGRVSMNMTTIDISGVPHPKVGEEVEIYSDELSAPNSLTKAAATANTLHYELLVHLAESVKRQITNN